MATFGLVALVAVGLEVLMALFVFVRSMSDLARYRRLRRM